MSQTISVLAESLGLRADTLRNYERVGLLYPPERTAAGYRIYDDDAADRLRFIKDAQHMGLHLADIKELLDVRDHGRCPCGHTEILVNKRLAEVEADMARLRGESALSSSTFNGGTANAQRPQQTNGGVRWNRKEVTPDGPELRLPVRLPTLLLLRSQVTAC
jgi:DNA-binding transcriptional MerR regulator